MEQDLIEFLKDNLNDWDEFFFNDYAVDGNIHGYMDHYLEDGTPNPWGDWLKYELVEDFGGEGQGDDYYKVFRFYTAGGQEAFVQFDGWYASYEGSSYDDWFFVAPKEVMVIVYEPITGEQNDN